jgi:cytoskeletal protein RodZ
MHDDPTRVMPPGDGGNQGRNQPPQGGLTPGVKFAIALLVAAVLGLGIALAVIASDNGDSSSTASTPPTSTTPSTTTPTTTTQPTTTTTSTTSTTSPSTSTASTSTSTTTTTTTTSTGTTTHPGNGSGGVSPAN